MMILHQDMIILWRDSVKQYCEYRGIPNMDLKNLRRGDIYDFGLYVAYKNVEQAIANYRKTPESPVYADELVDNIKKWYALTSGSKLKKQSLRMMPNAIFARFFGYIK